MGGLFVLGEISPALCLLGSLGERRETRPAASALHPALPQPGALILLAVLGNPANCFSSVSPEPLLPAAPPCPASKLGNASGPASVLLASPGSGALLLLLRVASCALSCGLGMFVFPTESSRNLFWGSVVVSDLEGASEVS